MTKGTVVEVMNHLIGFITPIEGEVSVNQHRGENQEKVITIAEECINDLIDNSKYKDSPDISVHNVGKRAYDVLEELYERIKVKLNKDETNNTKSDDKVIHMGWVGIPVNGVWRYRCGNINCARLIPFGCEPNELDFCPYCGAIADKDKPEEY
jgi:hypothetical protein